MMITMCLLSVFLLDPVSTDRFFTTSGDGKTYLKIAPGESISVRGSHPGAHLAIRQGRQLLAAPDQKGAPKEGRLRRSTATTT